MEMESHMDNLIFQDPWLSSPDSIPTQQEAARSSQSEVYTRH